MEYMHRANWQVHIQTPHASIHGDCNAQGMGRSVDSCPWCCSVQLLGRERHGLHPSSMFLFFPGPCNFKSHYYTYTIRLILTMELKLTLATLPWLWLLLPMLLSSSQFRLRVVRVYAGLEVCLYFRMSFIQLLLTGSSSQTPGDSEVVI